MRQLFLVWRARARKRVIADLSAGLHISPERCEEEVERRYGADLSHYRPRGEVVEYRIGSE